MIELLKLKLSLYEAIEGWANEASGTEAWDQINTYVGNNVVELMTNSAFNILLAQKDLAEYLRANNLSHDPA